jgi:hypothetical protein
MEELFKQIGSQNLPAWMIMLVLLVLGIIYLLKEPITSWIKTKTVKQDKSTQSLSDLKSHDIFNTCERIKHEIKFMKFYTHGKFDAVKTKMCVDFTNFKATICSKHFKEFLDRDLQSLSYDELKSEILKAMGEMHDEYIQATRSHWLSKGIDNEDVDYIIQIFEKFRYDVVVSFQHRIEATFATTLHKTKYDKILAIYDMFAMGIDLLPKDMQTTFESLNGRFTNTNYK